MGILHFARRSPPASNKPEEDRYQIMHLVGLVLPVAVWVLGLISPPRTGLTPQYLASFTLLLAGIAVLDLTCPLRQAPLWRRLTWLVGELALCFFVVRTHGSLGRPAFIYLLPTIRALVLFGPKWGLVASLTVVISYLVNVGLYAWPDRLHEYPNYISFFSAPYLLAVLLTFAVLKQTEDRRRLQILYDELHVAHQQLQTMHQQARELAVNQERNRLAREIHDSLAHYLTVINVQLEAAEKLGADRLDKALEAVRRARRLTLRSLQEVRQSVAALRAPVDEHFSLPEALERLTSDFSDSTGITVRIDLKVPHKAHIAPETGLALYRAAQEGLTNVHRHARATNVHLNLTMELDRVLLAVQDDGVGPPADLDEDKKGFGLQGLKERVELLGGQLTFGPGPFGGSLLAIELPVPGGRDES